MSKTLGYYLNSHISDNPLLIEIEESYDSFETLNLSEQLYVLQFLATSLGGRAEGEVAKNVSDLAIRIVDELEPADQEGLIEALVARIRGGDFVKEGLTWEG